MGIFGYETRKDLRKERDEAKEEARWLREQWSNRALGGGSVNHNQAKRDRKESYRSDQDT